MTGESYWPSGGADEGVGVMRGLSGAATCGWVEVSSELLEGADVLWRVGGGKPSSKNVTSLASHGDAQVMGTRIRVRGQ